MWESRLASITTFELNSNNLWTQFSSLFNTVLFLLYSVALHPPPKKLANLSNLMTDIIPNSLWSKSSLLADFWGKADPHRRASDHGEKVISFPSGQLYSWVAGMLSLALCMCECQTGRHWRGDLRIGEKLLAEAVLEVPFVRLICSRRVKPWEGGVGGGGLQKMQIACWTDLDLSYCYAWIKTPKVYWTWWNRSHLEELHRSSFKYPF